MPMANPVRLDQLLVGQVAPLGETTSGIAKAPVAGPLRLTPTGFDGDAQADTRVHGGPDKAVHHYPFDHYAPWRAEVGERPVLSAPGGFGENLSTLGLDERAVAAGDVFRLGSAVIEVSQGRQPCWKLNLRLDVPDMALRVQTSGRTGWYYRVLEPGLVAPGDAFQLLDRRSPDWTIHRLWRTLYVDTLNRDELAAMAALDHLPEGWRKHARRRLESRRVEDWSARLNG